MDMAANVRFGEMSREQIRACAPEATLVIPVAAVEQHGPDLPVTVDVLACEAVAQGAAVLAAREIAVTVAPIVAYGYSPHHLPYPGVLSLQAETLLSVLRDLGESAYASGFRRVFYLNGHGGNDEIIRLAAREISNRHAMLGGAASYWTLALGALRQGLDTHGMPIPGHAGDFEASLVAALRPDLISRDQPAPPKGASSALSLPPDVALFAQADRSMQRIGGYTDRSGAPSAALGQTMLTIVQQEVARALVAFHRAWPPQGSVE